MAGVAGWSKLAVATVHTPPTHQNVYVPLLQSRKLDVTFEPRMEEEGEGFNPRSSPREVTVTVTLLPTPTRPELGVLHQQRVTTGGVTGEHVNEKEESVQRWRGGGVGGGMCFGSNNNASRQQIPRVPTNVKQLGCRNATPWGPQNTCHLPKHTHVRARVMAGTSRTNSRGVCPLARTRALGMTLSNTGRVR
jgi:hypothetical protein